MHRSQPSSVITCEAEEDELGEEGGAGSANRKKASSKSPRNVRSISLCAVRNRLSSCASFPATRQFVSRMEML